MILGAGEQEGPKFFWLEAEIVVGASVCLTETA